MADKAIQDFTPEITTVLGTDTILLQRAGGGDFGFATVDNVVLDKLAEADPVTIGSTLDVDGGLVTIDSASDQPYIRFMESGVAKCYLGESSIVGGGAGFYDLYATAGLGIRLFTSTSLCMTLQDDNHVLFGGNAIMGAGNGIDFSANTHSASMTSEILDDYEKGAWNPAISGSITGGSVTYSTQTGTYTKVGNICHVTSLIILSAVSSQPSGTVQISGLPFNASVASTYSDVMQVGYNDVYSNETNKCYVLSGNSVARMIPTGITQSNLDYSTTTLSAGYLAVSGVYETA